MNDLAGSVASGVRWLNGTKSVTIVVCFSKPMRSNGSAPGTPLGGHPPEVLRLVNPNTGAVVDLAALAGPGEWQAGKLLTVDSATSRITQLGAARYDYDTWVGHFTLPPTVTSNGVSATAGPAYPFRLEIKARDQVSLNLDGDPSTVARFAAGAFSFYEDGANPASTAVDGGADRSHRSFAIDTKPPTLRKP